MAAAADPAAQAPSGSGKTTVFNLIGALDRPTTGRVVLEGRDLGELGRRDLARLRRDRIGFVDGRVESDERRGGG